MAYPKTQTEFLRAVIRFDNSKDLKIAEKAVLMVMADYGDRFGTNIFPSITTIANNCCCSRQTVIATIGKLIEKEYISKVSTGNSVGGNTSNHYGINLAKFGYEYPDARAIKEDKISKVGRTYGKR